MLSRWSRAISHISRIGSRLPEVSLYSHSYAKVASAASPTATTDSVEKILPNKLTVNFDKLFWTKPASLALAPDSRFRIVEPKYEGIRYLMLKMMLYYSKQSKTLRGVDVVYRRVIAQVDKPSIYEVFNLEKTFKMTFSLLVLHMWLCLRRLKEEGKEGVEFGQHLYEMYNHDVELRVSKAGVNLLLTKWMKELEKIFYGNIVAYDAAMLPEAKADELPTVLWKNVFSDDGTSEPDNTALRAVQAMARYVRLEVSSLSLTDKEAMFSGNFMFTPLDDKLKPAKR